MKILFTGASSFTGFWFARALAAAGHEVVATFRETDPPTGILERGDRSVITWQVASASGYRYEGQNVMFRIKGDDVVFSWFGDEIQCRARTQ